MFEKITSTPKKAATHIVRCRARYAATAGIITGAVIMRKLDADTYGQAIAFIEEKGLTDEFFTPVD
jgi:hypothetical protein